MEFKMEKIILIFFDGIVPILLIVFLFVFVIPIIKKKGIKKDSNEIKILNSDTIISETNIITGISAIGFMILFIIVGVIIIYLGVMSNNILSTLIFGGIFFIGIPVAILIKSVIRYYNVSKGKYVIVEDVLEDMEMIVNHNNDNDNETRDQFYFYFKDYFKKYNKRVSVRRSDFNSSKEGDEFYLVFCNKAVYAFNKRKYRLEDNNKILDVNELDSYINVEKYTDEINTNTIKVDKKKLKKDFLDRSQKITVLILIIVSLFLLAFCICIYKNVIEFNVIALITVFIVFVFFMMIALIKIKYLYTIIKNIKYDNFKIKIDTVMSLNNNVDFKDSNTIISFKFKDYKKIVYGDKKDYNITSIGDEFYLVFVKGQNEPIKVYRAKDCILEDDVKGRLM